MRHFFGDAVAGALRDAFIGYWRHVVPKLAAEQPAEERSLVRIADLAYAPPDRVWLDRSRGSPPRSRGIA